MNATCASHGSNGAATTPRMACCLLTVLSNERIEGGCHRLAAQAQGRWPDTAPGQFAMLSMDHPRFPILPRPFSLLGWRREGERDLLEWLIMPVGAGTALLCSLRPGETFHAVGPLGGRMDEPLPEGPLICVAGGYGIAPFIFLLDLWGRRGDRRLADTTVVFGARSAARLSLAQRLQDSGARVEWCTEDGSRGFAGRVDARLAQLLPAARPALVLTCGPEPMMEAVGRLCREAGVPARASLETVMGCGYAVCNGCAVAVADGGQADGYTYELACREGTVFDESRLQWHTS